MLNKFPIAFYFDGQYYRGEVKPLAIEMKNRIPTNFQIFLNHVYCGIVRRTGTQWESDSPKCAVMAETLGNNIYDWYQ